MRALLLGAASLLVSMSTAQAGDRYIQFHLGAFQQTSDTVEFAGETFLEDAFNVSTEADADLGLAIGGLIGTYVLPTIAIEGEFTYRTANVDEFSAEGVDVSIDDDIGTMAFMLNGVFRPQVPLLPEPYVGVGFGYVASNLDNLGGDSTDGAFAYQIKGGLTFDFLPTPGKIGVEVAYLQTNDFDLGDSEIDVDYAYGGVTGLLTFKKNF